MDQTVIRALAVTVSNRAAAGVYADTSGPVLVELLRAAGCAVVDGPLVIPDGDPVEAALRDAIAAGYDVVVTTGGTGLTPGDLTPEMTRRVLELGDSRDRRGAAFGRSRGRGAVRDLVAGPGRGGGPDADRQPARLFRRRAGRHGRPGARARARGVTDQRG